MKIRKRYRDSAGASRKWKGAREVDTSSEREREGRLEKKEVKEREREITIKFERRKQVRK